jgi:hypothetical protein
MSQQVVELGALAIREHVPDAMMRITPNRFQLPLFICMLPNFIDDPSLLRNLISLQREFFCKPVDCTIGSR